MISSKSGFLTEVEIFSAGKPKAKSLVKEEDVISELAKDYSAYMQSQSKHERRWTRDAAKETILNSLAAQIQRKQAALRAFNDTLAQLQSEHRSLLSESASDAFTRLSTAVETQ